MLDPSQIVKPDNTGEILVALFALKWLKQRAVAVGRWNLHLMAREVVHRVREWQIGIQVEAIQRERHVRQHRKTLQKLHKEC